MAGGYTLQLDPIGYVNSATATLRVLGTLRDAGHTLTGALHGSAQMAGSDQGGQAWADSYDDAARSIIRNTTTMLNAFDSLGVALGITGYNHAVAEHRATGLAGTPGAFSVPVSSVPEALGTPASSHGGNREFPWGFQQLSDLIGMAWPDGDTGKLKAAGSAWDAFADALEGINTTGPLSHIGGFVAPEIAGITAKFDSAKSAIRELATQSRTVAKGCRKRASSIDDTHNKTAQELLQLAITIGATVAASALLTPFTLGISDAAGAGAVALETGVSVARIVTWLTEAVEDAFAVAGGLTEAASAIEGVGGVIAQIGIRVAPYVPRAITGGLSLGIGNTIGTGIVQGDDADLGKAFADGFVGGFVGEGVLSAGKVGVDGLAAAARAAAARASTKPLTEAELANMQSTNYLAAVFGKDLKPYYEVANPKLGAPGRPFFSTTGDDAAAIRNASDAARLTGGSPSTQSAYINGEDVYAIVYPRVGIPAKLPTAADARGWAHFLEGGTTALRIDGPKGGFLVNSTREFVIDGGTPVPKGSVLVKISNGEWEVLRRIR
jgi:hypothetical protein